LKGLLDIFNRKSNEEVILTDLMMLAQAGNEVKKELEDQDEKLEKFYKELSFEIKNFKTKRENDLLQIIKKFFKDKYDCNSAIKKIFEVQRN